MRRRGLSALRKADIVTGMGDDDQPVFTGTVDDTHITDIVKVRLLVDRMELDAPDAAGSQTAQNLTVIRVFRVDTAERYQAGFSVAVIGLYSYPVDGFRLSRAGSHREDYGVIDPGLFHGSP